MALDWDEVEEAGWRPMRWAGVGLSLAVGAAGCGGPPEARFPGADGPDHELAARLLGGPPDAAMVVRVDRMRQDRALRRVLDGAADHLDDELVPLGGKGDALMASKDLVHVQELQLFARRRTRPGQLPQGAAGAGGVGDEGYDDADAVLVVLGVPPRALSRVERHWQKWGELDDGVLAYRATGLPTVTLWVLPERAWIVRVLHPEPGREASPALDLDGPPPRSALEPDALLAAYVLDRGLAGLECEECAMPDGRSALDGLVGGLVHVDAADADGDVGFGARLLYADDGRAGEVAAWLEDGISEEAFEERGLGKLAPVLAAVLERTVHVDRDAERVDVDITLPLGLLEHLAD